MTAFIACIFVLAAIRVCAGVYWIAGSDYPRSVKMSVTDDLVSMLARIGLVIWAGILLFI